MNLQQKTLSGTFWQILNVGIFSIMNIAFLMVMARLVEKEIHGIFIVMQLAVLILSMISKTGIYLALVRRNENTPEQISFAFWSSFIVGAIFSVLIYSVSPYITFYNQEIPIDAMQAISVFFIVFSFGLVSEALIIREMKFKALFISKCGSYFLGNILIGIYLAYNGYGIWSFVIGYLAFTTFNSILKYFFEPHSLKWNFSILEWKEVMHFSIGFTLSELLNSAATYIDKLIIGKFVSLDLLAIFQKGQHTSRLPVSVFGSTFDNVLYSFFSKVQDQPRKKKKYFLRLSSLVWTLALFIVVFTVCYSKQIVLLILGREWSDSVYFFQLFALITPLILVAKISDSLFRADNKLYLTARIKAIYLTLIIICSLFTFKFDLQIVSLYIGSVYVLYILIMIVCSVRYLKLGIIEYVEEIIPAISIAVILIAINYFIKSNLSVRIGYLSLISIAVIIHVVVFVAILIYHPSLFGMKNLKFIVDIVSSNPVLKKIFPNFLINHLQNAN